MNMKKELKVQKVLDATEAAEFFHTLGMAIAWTGDEKLARLGLPLSDFEKVKLSIKREGQVFLLKVTVKEALPATAGDETPTPAGDREETSYKALKKRLKGSFAELKKLLTQDVPPSAAMVRRFLDDSSRMISFPGLGDEHYERYQRCCLEFEKAFASGDLEAMRHSLAAVEACKKTCHAHYK